MKTAYLIHILIWMLPALAGQWLIGWKILRRNLKPVLLPTLIIGIYLTFADLLAVRAGIWFFDDSQTLHFRLLGLLPIEEVLFFFLTGLLIAQNLVLFLPDSLRFPPQKSES